MLRSSKRHIALFYIVFAGILAFSQPSISAYHYTPLVRSNPLSQSASVQWPTNSINLSQLQSIFSQNPGLSMLNVQFPNQANLGVTPDIMNVLTNTLQNEAQSYGLGGKLPDLVLSALGDATGLKTGGLPQLSINDLNPDNIKSHMDDALRQLRYGDLGLGNMLPDWLKSFLLAIYDGVYNCLQFLGDKIASMIHR